MDKLAIENKTVLFFVNMFISGVKFLTWGFMHRLYMGIDSISDPASGGCWRNCSFLVLLDWLNFSAPEVTTWSDYEIILRFVKST